MRHRKTTKTLDRKKASRTALLKNLAVSLIVYEKIKTTEAKARVLRPIVEKLITRGKVNNLANRRQLLKFLPDSKAVEKILDVLGPKYKNRPGGYLRIIKIGQREGDGARVAEISLVD